MSLTLDGVGSPPHTRGILHLVTIPLSQIGFTPAYAGNTPNFPNAAIFHQVHPRIRGEYTDIAGHRGSQMGSPPHTRGILLRGMCHYPRGRFTPAYAGNTSPVISSIAAPAVHPRIRGEYFLSVSQSMRNPGSPPHTRGILNYELALIAGTWFPPAYAGNTNAGRHARQGEKVHPRIRGEYQLT